MKNFDKDEEMFFEVRHFAVSAWLNDRLIDKILVKASNKHIAEKRGSKRIEERLNNPLDNNFVLEIEDVTEIVKLAMEVKNNG
jgi:hypothetical protein